MLNTIMLIYCLYSNTVEKNLLYYKLSFFTTTVLLLVILTYLFQLSTLNKYYLPTYLCEITFLSPDSSRVFLQTPINVGLINPLVIWHPTIMFIVIFLYFIFNFFFKKNFFFLLLLTLIFFVLGSWWSAQELLWLGWWNWDGVENTLLIFMFMSFTICHFCSTQFLTKSWHLLFLAFFFIFFLILNKTNIFKSIHSFTNSLFNNMSLCYIIAPLFFYLKFFFFKKFFFKKLFYYLVSLPLVFVINYLLFNTNQLASLSFFFYLNFIFFVSWVFFFKKPSHFYMYILLFTSNIFYGCTLLVFIFFFLMRNKSQLFIHKIFIFVFMVYASFLHSNLSLYQNIFIFENLANNNILHVNKTIFLQNNSSFVQFNLVDMMFVFFKNTLISTTYLVLDSVNYYKKIKYILKIKYFSYKLICFFLVTNVFYLKQKQRYNYYSKMYLFKGDFLLNQQKARKISSNITKFNWASKSVYQKTNHMYILSNQNSVDLRLYKLMLRKLKKKLLNFKVRTFLYMFPNKKKAYKSKNSRMGKGKGMNNRFYFCCKRTRPLIIFLNLNATRFLKLKHFLRKFFDYKYFTC